MPNRTSEADRSPPDLSAAPVGLDEVRAAVDAAAGRAPGTLLLRHARLVNVLTSELEETPTDVLIAGRLIAGIGDYADAEADTVIDLGGAWLAPGLIDGHVHIESSLVGPAAYAEAVVPRGVTGVVCDPHEIGNVAGVPGIEWLLSRSDELPLDVWVTAPSCVPSTRLETAGAELGLMEIADLLEHRRVVGVAEIMSFPDVIAGDPENLSKALLAEAARATAEGHAPGVSGHALQAYLASGIESDHEATTLAEGTEKLRNGMFLMVREGSVTRNLGALLPLVQPRHGDRIGFVTDDRLPHDLLDEGGVDCLVRGAIAGGADAAYAVRCATWNVARHYRLPRRGAVAPGYVADLVVIDDLPAFHAAAVFKEGARVAREGRLDAPAARPEIDDASVRGTITLPPLGDDALRIPDPGGEVRVIVPVPYQVLTEETHLRPTVRDGAVVADPERDVLKLICVERHGRSAEGEGVGLGLVTGFGMRRGALASSVGHDHHNILAVGASDDDLRRACERLEQIGGGFVVVADGEVRAELALPIAGLVTDRPLGEVREALDRLEAAAAELGNRLPAPFMTLSFLGLAVIPELRVTDRGLVDVVGSRLVPLGVAPTDA